jgi:hypothetical protein
LALSAATPAQTAAPPRVGAQLIIDSAELNGALGDRRVVVEADVSKWLARAAESQFGFLTWVSAHDPDPPPDRWIVRLQDDASPGRSSGTNYFFNYFKVSAGGAEQPLRGLAKTFFDSDRNPLIPTDDAAAFTKAAQDVLGPLLRNEAFGKSLAEEFLYTIALTTELEVNEDAQALLLPFSFRDLKVARSSRIAVEFNAPLGGEGNIQSGEMQLRAAACLSRPQIGGRIRGEISRFEFPPTMITQPKFWDDAAVDILQSVVPTSRRIRMLEYHRDNGDGDPCLGNQPIVSGP